LHAKTGQYKAASPKLSQHAEQILKSSLSLGDGQIKELEAQSVIQR